jgi:hypothetical protein
MKSKGKSKRKSPITNLHHQQPTNAPLRRQENRIRILNTILLIMVNINKINAKNHTHTLDSVLCIIHIISKIVLNYTIKSIKKTQIYCTSVRLDGVELKARCSILLTSERGRESSLRETILVLVFNSSLTLNISFAFLNVL